MNDIHPALRELPSPFTEIVPELVGFDLPAESRSTCSRCPMACKDSSKLENYPDQFLPDVRCCTHHPLLYNWQLGQIIHANSVPAKILRERIINDDGRDGLCMFEPSRLQEYRDRHQVTNYQTFGRDRYFTCPFWREGKLSCGIWEFRNAVCRTWFCKYEKGPRGQEFWFYFRDLLRHLEKEIGEWCIRQGGTPSNDASAEQLIDWYVLCYQRVSRHDWSTETQIRSGHVEDLLNILTVKHTVMNQQIPDKVAPLVDEFKITGNQVEFQGYSPYDKLTASVDIFTFLSLLDGRLLWKEALTLANQKLPEHRQIAPEVVQQLFERGLLEQISGPEDLEVGLRATITDGVKRRRFTPGCGIYESIMQVVNTQ